MAEFLSSLKDKRFVGVKELADEAGRILRSVGSDQQKKTVVEYPNERTIRYYINEGLLPPRLETQDQSAVYGYEHILVLLTIKKLQADGLPISVIRSLIAGKSVEELEKLLGEQVMVFTDHEELDRFVGSGCKEEGEDMAVFSMAAREDEHPASPPTKNKATEFLESVLFGRPKEERPVSRPLFSRPAPAPRVTRSLPETLMPAMPNIAEPPSEDEPKKWTRVQVEPGLELHIEEGYRAPTNSQDRSLLIRAIEKILTQRH